MAGWDDTPPGKDKDTQASHFAFNQFSAAFATDAPISASKFGREKRSFDDWSAPPVYALDEHASNKPTLFVGNLSWTITSEALFARLGGIGSVVACEVKRNGRGQSKGFALATFQSEEAAQRAIAEFHGAVLEGRRLVVRPDHEPAALEHRAVELGDGPLRRLLGLERRQREALRLAPAVALHLAGDDAPDAPEPREERLGRDGPAQVADEQRGLVARVLVERVDRRRAPVVETPLFPSEFGCADRCVRGKGGAELVEREVRRLGVLVLAWRRVVPAGHGCLASV